MQTLPTRDPREVLGRHGFEPTPDGWHRGSVAFRKNEGWLVFSAPVAESADPLGNLGEPGLWKSVCDERQARRVFALREDWFRDDDLLLTDGDRSPLDCVLEWALATADGALPKGWTVPDRASVDTYLDKSRLTLVHRTFTRQMQIVHAADRLALRLPILHSVPANLPEGRLRWLRALLLEAQSAYHLFRLGFAPNGAQTSAIAEVDLSGAPPMLLEPLLSKSCDALRWVVAWLIESADFLAQADVASRALEFCAAPHNTNPWEKQT